jgi:hypothetical protein
MAASSPATSPPTPASARSVRDSGAAGTAFPAGDSSEAVLSPRPAACAARSEPWMSRICWSRDPSSAVSRPDSAALFTFGSSPATRTRSAWSACSRSVSWVTNRFPEPLKKPTSCSDSAPASFSAVLGLRSVTLTVNTAEPPSRDTVVSWATWAAVRSVSFACFKAASTTEPLVATAFTRLSMALAWTSVVGSVADAWTRALET